METYYIVETFDEVGGHEYDMKDYIVDGEKVVFKTNSLESANKQFHIIINDNKEHVMNKVTKEITKTKDYDWVKRLGQWHVYNRDRDEQYKTRCGVPMLGNNYANEISEHERVKCERCFKE